MVLQALGEDRLDAPAVTPIRAASWVLCSAAFRVSFTAATRRSMVRTSSTRMVSSAATASTTTKPPMTAPHHR